MWPGVQTRATDIKEIDVRTEGEEENNCSQVPEGWKRDYQVQEGILTDMAISCNILGIP